MLGRRWTQQEKQAYRGAFTIGRIVDELWILIAFVFFIVSFIFEDRLTPDGFDIFFFGGFLVFGGLSYWLLPRLLKFIMPQELWKSLPRGRFDAAQSISAPRTYRELFSRWFMVRRSDHRAE